jgi:hypothetical protein
LTELKKNDKIITLGIGVGDRIDDIRGETPMSYARQLGYEVRRMIEQDEPKKAKLMSELRMTEDELDRLCKGRLMLTFEEQDRVERLLNMSYDQIMEQGNTLAYQSVVHCMTPFSNPKNLDIIMDFIDAYIDAKEILQKNVLPS